jgi:hypothetical protein
LRRHRCQVLQLLWAAVEAVLIPVGLVYLLTELLADQVVEVPLVLQELLVAQALQGKVIAAGLEVHQAPMMEAVVVGVQQAVVVAQVHLKVVTAEMAPLIP